jgi:hypothetical protein
MTAELDVLADVAARLERANIPYMLTGSVALSYYARPRMTRDIDIVVELAGSDARAIEGLFAPTYYVSEADIARAITGGGMFNILHLDRLVKADLIVRQDAPYRRAEFARRQKVRFPGFDSWIVSREDLILSKLVWARDSASELQLRDVRALLGSPVDREYIECWAAELSVAELLADCSDAGHDR